MAGRGLSHRQHDASGATGTTSRAAPWAELAHVLPALTRLRHRITALELAAAHQADAIDLGAEVGAADTGAYWANTTRQTRAGAKKRLKLATALDHHDTTRTAMTAGTVAEDQAAVIVKWSKNSR